MLKSVIFDMDGVLIDIEPIHFQVEKVILKNLNIRIQDEELDRFVLVTG